MMFKELFYKSSVELGISPQITERLWNDIERQYREKGRCYHNLEHLDHLASVLNPILSRLNQPNTVVLAIGYHDIIYDTQKSDNEIRSADLAARVLKDYMPDQQIRLLREMILATSAHEISKDNDTNYFTDADLSILGAAPARYKEYSVQIRQEYQRYPDTLYVPGRQKVLSHFLNMPRIYKTDHCYNLFESQARINLRTELNLLSENA